MDLLILVTSGLIVGGLCVALRRVTLKQCSWIAGGISVLTAVIMMRSSPHDLWGAYLVVVLPLLIALAVGRLTRSGFLVSTGIAALAWLSAVFAAVTVSVGTGLIRK